ncbi:hypothetical protein V12B01_13420 [Vibrio splendidus 12B01]|nr:hypothetical protein V12B01_13420 [Vibrio splendidus 12B01]
MATECSRLVLATLVAVLLRFISCLFSYSKVPSKHIPTRCLGRTRATLFGGSVW